MSRTQLLTWGLVAALSKQYTVLVITFNLYSSVSSAKVTSSGIWDASPRLAQKLGVGQVKLYAKAPVASRTKTVTLHVWMKWVTVAPVDDPMQPIASQDKRPAAAINGFVWVEDISSIHQNRWGVRIQTANIKQWAPALRLQTSDGSTTDAIYHKTPADGVEKLRALFFYFPLPEGHNIANCFKIFEATFPKHRATLCLETSSTRLCSHLAPQDRFTPSSPSLWTVLIPFRTQELSGDALGAYMEQTANRIQRYVQYQRRINATGVLLYTDQFTAQGLSPHLHELLQEGSLVFVEWEQTEGDHYNYDQPLVYSHAFLGLSACGPNIWVQATNVNELLYTADGNTWLSMYKCLQTSTTGSGLASVFRILRYKLRSSTVNPEAESELWSNSMDSHPAPTYKYYDLVYVEPKPTLMSKVLACPAYQPVSVWVDNAWPLYGRTVEASAECVKLLVIENYFKKREYGSFEQYEDVKLDAQSWII